MRVLIAEDDPDQLALRSLLMKQAGFEAIRASTKDQALEIAAIQAPLCAVIDLRLPDEACGLGLIRGLKALNPKMHLFVLTGSTLRQLADAPEWKLVDAVFQKGSPSGPLLAQLRKVERTS